MIDNAPFVYVSKYQVIVLNKMGPGQTADRISGWKSYDIITDMSRDIT